MECWPPSTPLDEGSFASYSIVAIARGTVEPEPEVQGWLEGLSTAQFAHAAFHVDPLPERGALLGEPYTKQLDGKLRKLRFHLARTAVRITYSDRTRSAHHPAERVPQDPDAGRQRGGPRPTSPDPLPGRGTPGHRGGLT